MIDNNAPAKATRRHPKRSHKILVSGPQRKFREPAMAPTQATIKRETEITFVRDSYIIYTFQGFVALANINVYLTA